MPVASYPAPSDHVKLYSASPIEPAWPFDRLYNLPILSFRGDCGYILYGKPQRHVAIIVPRSQLTELGQYVHVCRMFRILVSHHVLARTIMVGTTRTKLEVRRPIHGAGYESPHAGRRRAGVKPRIALYAASHTAKYLTIIVGSGLMMVSANV